MKDKTVLVTGSSRGIGLAIAREFLRQGARVVLNCRESVNEMLCAGDELKKISPHVLCVRADVADYNECAAMFKEISSVFKGLNILVNNAGAAYYGLFQDMKPVDISRVIGVNLTGTINCSRLAVPDMVKNHRGIIINISSIWGGAGASCEAVYSASKGGVDSFTKALAKELGPTGVRVNAIACGAVETAMNSRLTNEERESFSQQIPLGRFGLPDEIAKLACFLAGDGASYITGQVIRADGGLV